MMWTKKRTLVAKMKNQKKILNMKKTGTARCKRGNLVPCSAPVARVHPRTAQHCYFPY